MRFAFGLSVLLTCGLAHGDLLYSIGNSLTADARPWAIRSDVGYHIDYGDSLSVIHDNPAGNGIISIRPDTWDVALSERTYQFLSVQPYTRSHPDANVPSISDWIEMQPGAVVVLHSPWPNVPDNGDGMVARFEKAYHDFMNSDDAALLNELRALYPTREFRETHSLDALHAIVEDAAAGIAPVALQNIYDSDFLHMSDLGDYLMHNLLRASIGQPMIDWTVLGLDGASVDPVVWDYLDSKVVQFHAGAAPAAVPEPGSVVLLTVLGLGFVARRTRNSRRETLKSS